jgi:hypothetical protein
MKTPQEQARIEEKGCLLTLGVCTLFLVSIAALVVFLAFKFS